VVAFWRKRDNSASAVSLDLPWLLFVAGVPSGPCARCEVTEELLGVLVHPLRTLGASLTRRRPLTKSSKHLLALFPRQPQIPLYLHPRHAGPSLPSLRELTRPSPAHYEPAA
jgi:hypothetical protein